MHPVVMPELIRQYQAELLHDAERHRLAATVRRLRTVGSPRCGTTRSPYRRHA